MAVIEFKAVRQDATIKLNKRALHRRIGNYMVASTVKKIEAGIMPPNAPLTVAVKKNNLPLKDRGNLLSSFSAKSDEGQVRIGTNRIRAKLLQYGGMVKPKGQWLWIPADPRTRTLLGRYAHHPTAVIKGLRSEGNLVWFHTKPTHGVVMARKGKRGKPWVVFVLKKSVKIPARPFLFFSDFDMSMIQGYLRDGVKIKKGAPVEIS